MVILFCCSRQELLDGVYSVGFNEPIIIQNDVLPMLLADPPMNIVALSEKGMGRTTALALSMLSRVDVSKKWP